MATLNLFRQVLQITQPVVMFARQVMRQVRLRLRAHMALAAERLFLQKQLALYEARHAPSQQHMNATRFILVWLSYWFDWQPALTIVQLATFKRWRRQGWRLLWKAPATLGRPPIPPELQALIRRMAREYLTWGQQRLANELRLKLGLRVSPRTVRKYMPRDCVGGPGQRGQSQRWSTFIRNHARRWGGGIWATPSSWRCSTLRTTPRTEERAEWVGDECDPDTVDLDEINKALQSLLSMERHLWHPQVVATPAQR